MIQSIVIYGHALLGKLNGKENEYHTSEYEIKFSVQDFKPDLTYVFIKWTLMSPDNCEE